MILNLTPRRIILPIVLTASSFLTVDKAFCALVQQNASDEVYQNQKIKSVSKINPTSVEVIFEDNNNMIIDFYGENIFRIFQDNNGGVVRDPQAFPPAKILVDNARKSVADVVIVDNGAEVSIKSNKVEIKINKETSLINVVNLENNKVAVSQKKPFSFENKNTSFAFQENDSEYFYGGGVQNGRFSHKGKRIAIENQNSWTDNGVASPNPFYWSTNGYGLMWHTFAKGIYDFDSQNKNEVNINHESNYLDIFVMVDEKPVDLLNDFYQLTGNPVLLPKFGFYQGHLNAYNRDYWKESENGILFEDGKKYKESQTDKDGVKESLNGENNNYQFSARAVIDRYNSHDMPLGWLLPNDGYGAGYGQTETLDGNIANLKALGDYAREKGVEIGLWTQSDLHPKPEISALLQRDIVKEVKDAGVRVLKTDVAWVGAGYSFGLNGISDAASIMPYYGNDSRPFIISLDGWAGSQRYAGIWSGDQTGGQWEYIRFHIPTYIGSGLSGQPNISSDMDGIFGGKNLAVNTRDFQWKTFTPMELNMDGWGSNEKYPHALGEPATSINRWYLKMKGELIPYTYSLAKEAVNGLPMVRAIFLEYPNDYTLGKATQYEFLYGPYFLVAPIYQSTSSDDKGNDVRHNIYLPDGEWVDYFTGDIYEGGRIINDFDSPIWKLPLFVKRGAIIPLANENNNVAQIDKNLRAYELYPYGEQSFNEYDDDGETEAYKLGAGVNTLVESKENGKGNLIVRINACSGNFNGFEPEKKTKFIVNVSQMPKKVAAKIGSKKVSLRKVSSLEDFENGDNVYFYSQTPELNKYATKGSEFEKVSIKKNPQLLVNIAKTNISENDVVLEVKGFKFETPDRLKTNTGTMSAPQNVTVEENRRGAYTLTPSWKSSENSDYSEIEFKGMVYSTIKNDTLLFEDLTPETKYDFKVRTVNKDGVSDWVSFETETKSDPLEFAIRNVQGETSCENQGGSGIANLFNFDETDVWHTSWSGKAVPFDIEIDLGSINTLDKFAYIPRSDAANGTLLEGKVYFSNDKESWTEAGSFEWIRDAKTKEFDFKEKPVVRYVKIEISKAVGNFGSGSEMYFFKVPNTESYLPGDINNDRLVDGNDLTSYMNYTGLRLGDSDFEGYVSNGDVNKNGLIDAYDISCVTTRMKGGVGKEKLEKVFGNIEISTSKINYTEGEIVEIKVVGKDLKSVNALSFAIPYDAKLYEFVGIEKNDTISSMENLTNDRLHTNGEKALYPTFVNIGKKNIVNGDTELMVIKFKARKSLKFNLQIKDCILVDRKLNSHKPVK
ncbi:MAG: glycoside hydrolase family 31 protein [Bacteroidales bacterium]|nr:glycoside hydrolase family 31 protein [Bacteroidales bacterium]